MGYDSDIRDADGAVLMSAPPRPGFPGRVAPPASLSYFRAYCFWYYFSWKG